MTRATPESDHYAFPAQFVVATVSLMATGDAANLARKAAVGETVHTLKSGSHLAYFTEGAPSDGPAVLCIHDLDQTKGLWLELAPTPGIYRIAIDRMGHGHGHGSLEPARRRLHIRRKG